MLKQPDRIFTEGNEVNEEGSTLKLEGFRVRRKSEVIGNQVVTMTVVEVC